MTDAQANPPPSTDRPSEVAPPFAGVAAENPGLGICPWCGFGHGGHGPGCPELARQRQAGGPAPKV